MSGWNLFSFDLARGTMRSLDHAPPRYAVRMATMLSFDRASARQAVRTTARQAVRNHFVADACREGPCVVPISVCADRLNHRDRLVVMIWSKAFMHRVQVQCWDVRLIMQHDFLVLLVLHKETNESKS